MKLKSIRMFGFKSFADKMEIDFKSNITAIVGPNGSGKSNIVDAIRWVLGEQSIKSLRGAGAMSDVIFAGSETRAPFKRAEVTLTFDNTDHFLNTDLTDVEVKRILYYTGENEYFINNVKVRLKDVTNLFLDSGVGNDTFSIISQGNIETIVNSKPVDRRVILESAAQVLKYKTRKTESLRKLEKTKDNLEKVDLVIQELATNVEPLKKQSEVAQKYLDYKNELQDLEISLTTHDIQVMHEDYERISNEIKRLEEEKEKIELSNHTDTSEIEKCRLQILQLEDHINEMNEELIGIHEELARMESEKKLLIERQNYEVDKTRIDENFISLKTNQLQLEKTIQFISSEKEDLEKQKADYSKEKGEWEEKQTFAQISYGRLHSDFLQAQKSLLMLENQINILENNIANDVNVPFAVKNVLNNPRLKGIHNTIGKLIHCDEKFTVALDVALASASNFIIVDDQDCAKEAILYLKDQKLGRATFFPLNVITSRYLGSSILEKASRIKGFLGVASDLVKYDEKYRGVIENQLGNVLVVDKIDTMNALGKLLEYKYRIVTLDGELLHAGGSLTGGSLKKGISLLKDRQDLQAKKKEYHDVQLNCETYEKKIQEYQTQLDDYQGHVQQFNEKIAVQNELIRQKDVQLQSNEKDLASIVEQIKGLEALNDNSIDKKIVNLVEEMKQLEFKRDILLKKLEQSKAEKSDLSSQVASLELENRKQGSEIHRIEQDLKQKEIVLSKYDTKMDYLLTLLSETYHMTYEKASCDYTLEMDSELARLKVTALRREMNLLGEVNLGSIAEYERVSTRYNFLLTQKDDLEKASNDLLEIIEEMDGIMKERLQTAFTKIQKEFSTVFHKMFKGGTGILKLTDPDNILETGIEIIAEPPGKKLNNIQLLSGGEKTLTAISLLFAILNVYPVPFCILDEVEAALDEANVDTFGQYLQEQKEKSEFILITHKKRTMEYASTLYGVTMQEQGVSKIVSVKLES